MKRRCVSLLLSGFVLAASGCGEAPPVQQVVTGEPPAAIRKAEDGLAEPSAATTAGSDESASADSSPEPPAADSLSPEPGPTSTPASADAVAATDGSSAPADNTSSADTVPATDTPPAADTVPATDTVPAGTAGEMPGAPTLMLGDAAPAVRIADWYMGTEVKEFAADKIYVVEFWATWCGPCRSSMPHLSSLQEKFGDKVQFIGVTDEDRATVAEFMGQPGAGDKKWSEIVKYAIALDDKQETTVAYMQASGQQGIPAAFVVGRTGRIEWIGHPMEIDEPLQKIVDGTWDVDAAREEFAMAQKEDDALNSVIPTLQQAMATENYSDAAAAMEKLVTEFPKSEKFQMIKFQILVQGKMIPQLNEFAGQMSTNYKDDADRLHQIAYILTVVDGKGADLDLALKNMARAIELQTEPNADMLDTLARVHFVRGDFPQALENQQKAIDLLPDNSQFKQTLAQYQEAASAPAEETPAEGTPADETPAENKDAVPE